MGLFGKKKKKQPDYGAKAHEIERNIWELENKQIVYLDKMKSAVKKQAEYKEKARAEKDKIMQRHYATLYINAEKEKEQYAYAINEISREIVSNAKMAQLVDRQTLFVELEKMQSLSLEEIGRMSDSISASRNKRETMTQLRGEAIDRALYHDAADVRGKEDEADALLDKWDTEEKIEKENRERALAAEEEAKVQPPPVSEDEEEKVEAFLKSLEEGESE